MSWSLTEQQKRHLEILLSETARSCELEDSSGLAADLSMHTLGMQACEHLKADSPKPKSDGSTGLGLDGLLLVGIDTIDEGPPKALSAKLSRLAWEDRAWFSREASENLPPCTWDIEGIQTQKHQSSFCEVYR